MNKSLLSSRSASYFGCIGTKIKLNIGVLLLLLLLRCACWV